MATVTHPHDPALRPRMIVAAGGALLLAIGVSVGLVGGSAGTPTGVIGIVGALAAGACTLAARRSAHERRAWLLLGGSLLCLGASAALTAVAGAGSMLAGVVAVAGRLLLIGGLVCLSSAGGGSLSRRRRVLDIAATTSAVLVLHWIVISADRVAGVALSPSSVLGGVVLVLDAMAIGIALIFFTAMPALRRLPLILGGVLLLALGDLRLVEHLMSAVPVTGSPGSRVAILGLASMALAACVSPPSGGPKEGLATWQEMVPYAPLAAAAVGLAGVSLREPVLISLCIGLGVTFLCRQVVLHLDHVALTRALRTHARHENVVAELARQASAPPPLADLDLLRTRACVLLHDVLGGAACKISELDPSGDWLTVRAASGELVDLIGSRIPASRASRAGRAILEGGPVQGGSVSWDSALVQARGMVDGVSVPIGGRDHPYGALSVHTTAPRHFTAEELRLLRLVADVIAGGMERTAVETRQASDAAVLEETGALLAETLRRKELVLEAGAMGFWEYDVAGDVMTLTPQLSRLMGIAGPLPVTGEHFIEIVDRRDRQHVRAAIAAALAGADEFAVEYRMGPRVTPDWIANTGRVERGADGSPVRIVGVVTDISGRRRTEEALAQQERLLGQARKMESLGQLAGGIAHDFNNLLTAIIGFAELAEMALRAERAAATDAVDGARAGAVEIGEIVRAAERARSLVAQLLAFSRLQPASHDVIDLNHAVGDVGEILHRLISVDILLSTQLDPGVLGVRADAVQLQQVLLNLVTNARDAMPDGGRLTVSTRQVWGGDGVAPQVILEVDDTGSGMSDEVAALAFDPFFTTKPEGAGTGMGLSVVYGIVTQLGGEVGVTSVAGVGTTVTVRLPGASPDVDVTPAVEAPATAVQPSRQAVVLVVEDQPQIRRLLESVLHSKGYRVLLAENGREALAMPRAALEGIDLLLTDVVMPELTGPMLAQELRSQRGDLRVLYISGYTRDERVDLADPRTAFLQKPFSVTELLAAVGQICEETATA